MIFMNKLKNYHSMYYLYFFNNILLLKKNYLNIKNFYLKLKIMNIMFIYYLNLGPLKCKLYIIKLKYFYKKQSIA